MLKEKKFHKEERNARVVFNQSQQIMEPQLYHPELELVHALNLEADWGQVCSIWWMVFSSC